MKKLAILLLLSSVVQAQTDKDLEHPVAYAFGTVLAGYLMVLPLWGIGWLWNRCVPNHRVNPWIVPLLGAMLFYLGFFMQKPITEDDRVVGLGMVPALIGILLGAWRWRRLPATDSHHLD